MANPVTPGIAADHSEAAHLHQRANQGTWNNNCYKEQKRSMPLLVVIGHGPSLLGRDWLAQLKLDWQELYKINQSEHTLQTILDKHKLCLRMNWGKLSESLQSCTAVSTNTKFYFCRVRPVPHSLRHKIEELQWLQDQKVIEPVQMSQWAAPIVPVLKPDGTIRICGDYKITVNKATKPDVYLFHEWKTCLQPWLVVKLLLNWTLLMHTSRYH